MLTHDWPAIRTALRDTTGIAHARLDAMMTGVDLARLPDYLRFLVASAGALVPIEAWLEASSVETVIPDWPDRRRVPALQADLFDLGGTADKLSRFDPSSADSSYILGVLYATEGSRLGAAFLRRQISPTVTATRYLDHGRGGSLWASYVQRVTSDEQIDLPSMASGAIAVFATFSDAFSRGLSAAQ